MSGNTYKVSKGKGQKNSLFSIIGNKLKIDALFENGLPAKYLPHTLFFTLIGIVYIGNNHWAEKMVRKIDKMQEQVEELRADYTSLKADYMFSAKQSEVAKKVKKTGLTESYTPPNKIIIDKSEY